MARLKISEFGGIQPSVDPRNLPGNGAQTAHNLDLRFGDFRPLKGIGDSVATCEAGARTIFRTPSGVWLSSVRDANYVNSQVNDAGVERVYVTGNNAEYPEVWEADTYYRLGVPAPTAAPTVAVVEADEYTQEDQDASANEIIDQVTALVRLHVSFVYLGADKPSNGGTLGGLWLDHGDDSELSTTGETDIAYVVPASGATVTAASDQYLTDPSLNGKSITYSSGGYWQISMPWKAWGYTLDEAGFKDGLLAILLPPDNVDPIFSDAQAQAITDRVADLVDPTKEPALRMVNNINQRQNQVLTQVLRTDTDAARAAALLSAIQNLDLEVKLLNAYMQGLVANLRNYVGGILAGYRYTLSPVVERLIETRVYIYTYVNEWGQESAPSPAGTLLELDQNDTVQVTIPACPVTSPYVPIGTWRLYRSVSANLGADFQFVAEVDVDTLAYTDSKRTEELEEVCRTHTWIEPPEQLIGLLGAHNGIMVGFFDKTLCFAEPFAPYAWPEEYRITVEFDIVAAGIFGQTIVVLTEGNPYYVSGADSASMSAQKMESLQACVSKRSAVSAEGGVFYASPDGVVMAGPQGVALLTQSAYSREDWQALNPEHSFAAFSEGVYLIFIDVPE